MEGNEEIQLLEEEKVERKGQTALNSKEGTHTQMEEFSSISTTRLD